MIAFLEPSDRSEVPDAAPSVCVADRGTAEAVGPRLVLLLGWVSIEGSRFDEEGSVDDAVTGAPLTWLDSVVFRLVEVG
jgi:hypothetical protein